MNSDPCTAKKHFPLFETLWKEAERLPQTAASQQWGSPAALGTLHFFVFWKPGFVVCAVFHSPASNLTGRQVQECRARMKFRSLHGDSEGCLSREREWKCITIWAACTRISNTSLHFYTFLLRCCCPSLCSVLLYPRFSHASTKSRRIHVLDL